MLFEIRNYHFNPDLFDGYKTWAKAEALPYLSQRLDIVGFWLNTNDPPEIGGEPQDSSAPPTSRGSSDGGSWPIAMTCSLGSSRALSGKTSDRGCRAAGRAIFGLR
jgi:hypothetical protein